MSVRLGSAARAALVLAAILAAASALDRLHSAVGPDDLQWLLRPAVTLVELAGGGTFEWDAGQGFFERSARLHVTEECAGLRFFIVATALLLLAWPASGRGVHARMRSALLAVATAFGLTVVANAVRLGIALQLSHEDLAAFGWSFVGAHRVTSMAVYGAAFVLLLMLARRARPKALAGWRAPPEVATT